MDAGISAISLSEGSRAVIFINEAAFVKTAVAVPGAPHCTNVVDDLVRDGIRGALRPLAAFGWVPILRFRQIRVSPRMATPPGVGALPACSRGSVTR